MAFHVACPITSKRICFCELGFSRTLHSNHSKALFFDRISRVSEFLSDPFLLRGDQKGTVEVAVPRVVPPPPPPPAVDGFGIDGEEALLSAQTKRAAMQKKAAAASLVAEDFARRFESGDLVDGSRELTGEEQGQSTVNVMCRICFSGENEGSEKARKMLSCKSCGKKYHRTCLKTWAQHRDLFHWSSWTCPSCRICEVCRRTGDPNKFMFCKRCDAAYHCYCQQPPHKNVGSGPYLCPKHTKCHSCGSSVPGNGLSTRWFLGYTCCDACGRLFVKGNYCPVCLKVYRDSESTPMVCCDVCQRWVHCECDDISDEKYLQFQVDNNLYYKCATCRGECYQVTDLEDSVRELWKRRDQADHDLIASLRAAAGLPTQDEIFSISLYSDDEDNGQAASKNEYGRSLKFSLKGLGDNKSPKKTKEHGKKSSNKKYGKKKENPQSFENPHRSEGAEMSPSPAGGSNTEGICPINQTGVLKHKFIDEIAASNEEKTPRVAKIKSSKREDFFGGVVEDSGKQASKSKTMKGTKLVIHLGGRNRNVAGSPRSDASSCQKEQDFPISNGSEDTSHRRTSDKYAVNRHDYAPKHSDFKGNFIKLGKVRQEVPDPDLKVSRGTLIDRPESTPPERERPRILLGKRSATTAGVGLTTEIPTSRVEKVSLRKHLDGNENNNSQTPSVSNSQPKDSKPLLKLKFKTPYFESQTSWVPQGDEEKSSVKGQRSKRKRPSSMEKGLVKGEDDDGTQLYQDNSSDEIMDANWILRKLGKDAVGKRIEFHQQSDNSWHKGVIMDVIEGTSTLSVHLEDGRSKTLELEKQGIRFVSQKQKRLKS